ncbi:transient receptor potential cation channel subfamily a member 1-like [Gigaspora margarita]|uniref:Transient receptor potential cation channel subfamily a member 1-like n=1 Tax=Gigaspora margarita TaxID=4874 RepID=A0A8H4EK65_GIGMA|nr:transient receptor potential cation channel subfamily a member 1-like [Gigaspora margarita]
MTSNSDVKIPIEEAPDENKILDIVCSPNMKHVATLDEINNISFWNTINQEKLLEKVKTVRNENIRIDVNGEKIFAISDNMHFSISLNRIDPYNFKILEVKSAKEILLNFPDWQNEIDILSFIDDGNIIMINTKYYKAYIFSSKEKDKNITWVCKSMIELKYFKKIYITPKGKLILFNDTIYEITMWDIEKLSANTRILIEWSCTLEFIEISDDEKLLFVCTKDKKTKVTSVLAFSTETEINISSFTTSNLVIDRLHLIASKQGERLLYRYINNSGKYNFNLMDLYNLKYPINVTTKLFEKNQNQETYIIKSDKIIYINDGNVLIEELVPDNWVEFLRKDLKDTNSITAPSEKTVDIIIKFIKHELTDGCNVDKEEFEGKFLKWGLELEDKSVRLTVVNKKRQLDILPSFDTNGKNFILHCEVLENDDFITFTRIGVIIWTYNKFTGIEMHYFWNDCNYHLEKFDFKSNAYLDRLKDWTSERILPASSYETVYKNLYIKFGESNLFKEFLERNIENEFYLACYGKTLMETFISVKDNKWVRMLGGKCVDQFMDNKNNNHLISKISLLSIIFENFCDLSENHPALITSTLASIGFVVPSAFVIPNSMSSHLSCYGRYYNLSKSFFDRLISNLRVHWINFKENYFQKFQERYPLLRDYIVKPVINYYYVGNSSTILVIPLPNFVSYPKKYNFWKELILPSPNPFTHSIKVDVKNEEFYRYLNGEALLEFKWNTFGRKYYLIIWAIYTVFLLSFIIAATCHKSISQTSLFILLNITICFGIWHLIFELRQFIYGPLTYMTSSWNILDLAAIISTTATSIYWLKNGSSPTWAITFSVLFLEIKFILFFRPNKFFGIYLAIIMKTVDKVMSFLIIFGLFILVFAHTLHLLIGSESEISQDLNTNMFAQFGSAAIASYYMMITGDSTPISLWVSNENIMIMLLILIVSFFLLIYLMNLFIEILSNLVSNENNYVAYLVLKCEIIEEIELLYMLPHQRRKENWFPYVIFYECVTIKLREHIMDILKDKWSGYEKPYISKNLNDVLLLPEKQSSFNEIEGTIKKRFVDQLHTLKEIEKKIEDLPVLKQDIKELKDSIEDLPVLKQDIKELKELIKDMKTNQ